MLCAPRRVCPRAISAFATSPGSSGEARLRGAGDGLYAQETPREKPRSLSIPAAVTIGAGYSRSRPCWPLVLAASALLALALLAALAAVLPAAVLMALAAGLARLLRVELVAGALLVRGAAALGRDLPLAIRIHRREPACLLLALSALSAPADLLGLAGLLLRAAALRCHDY